MSTETPKPTPKEAQAAKLSDLGITLTPVKFNSLGLNISIDVPSSIDDFDQLAGKTGEALNQAVRNVVYRSTLPVFREELCNAIAAKTGIERNAEFEVDEQTKEIKKDEKTGEPIFLRWSETEAKYLKRVAGDNVEQFAELANGIAAQLAFDPTASAPKASGPKKLAKMYLETAQALFDQGRGETVAANLATKLGLVVEPTVEGLAAAIKEDQSRKKLADEYAA